MTGWDVATLDVKDEAQLRAWWEARQAAQVHRPYDFVPSWEATRSSMPVPDPDRELVLMGVYDDGVLAGASQLTLPLVENQHMGFCNFDVRPESRRRGIGTALLEAAEDELRRRGRTILLTDTATAPGEDGPGVHFAAARGYTTANLEEHKVIDLKASEPGWAPLEAEAEQARGNYRIAVWQRIPDEHVEGYCGLLNIFMTQIPLGDIPLESLQFTPGRVRENEARNREVGREFWTAVAIAPDGSLAGSSDVNLRGLDPRIAHIGITLVLEQHRGHHLGLALKLATHRTVMADRPECELIATSNANVNEHMNAINERMGYRVVEQFHELQKRL